MNAWGVISRTFMVFLGFLLAAAASIATLGTLGVFWVADATTRVPYDEIDRVFNGFQQLSGIWFFVATAAPTLSILPAIIAVVAGELGNIRSALFYILSGGAAFAVLPVLSATVNAEHGLPSATYLAIFATAGFAGGLVYWLIAGRKA